MAEKKRQQVAPSEGAVAAEVKAAPAAAERSDPAWLDEYEADGVAGDEDDDFEAELENLNSALGK